MGKTASDRRYEARRAAAERDAAARGIVITREALGERDGWVCGLCHLPILNHETSSIDHIVPLAQHGPHTWENVRIAHPGCNFARGREESQAYQRVYARRVAKRRQQMTKEIQEQRQQTAHYRRGRRRRPGGWRSQLAHDYDHEEGQEQSA